MAITTTSELSCGATPEEIVQRLRSAAIAVNYDAARLAGRLDITPRTLHRLIVRQVGMSPQKWLLELRLVRAQESLFNAQSVKDVAYSLGFKTQSHFSRLFKQRFGTSLSEFQRRAQRSRQAHLPARAG
jgi:AraC-like DNA-binding protein